MSDSRTHDVAIIGGGIVGTSTAMALCEQAPDASVVILEAERALARHQTGHNSGVIHSGLYYAPGSLKALNCTRGREALYRFCEQHGVACQRCGKVIVARSEDELTALDELQRRGTANGLKGLERLSREQIREHEPHVECVAGLYVTETGIVDYEKVTERFAEIVRGRGGEIRTSARVMACARRDGYLVLRTRAGDVLCRNLINCAGLQSDRIARICGVRPGVRIVPFRGDYLDVVPDKQHLVRHLVYPVPDPRFPFLGVHLTRKICGDVEAGPNSVLAFRREGYRRLAFSLRDFFSWFFYAGFWRMARKHWRRGLAETWRSISKGAFTRSVRSLLPEIGRRSLRRGGVGVRAQALDPAGVLLDDFRIAEADRQIHVLNAPSPAATASICIGERIARMAVERFSLQARSGFLLCSE
ncbi:MAG: L-2-hydroxyglutarate oxidase [Deltaproteobacteria bacterium]|nr:L-2-hydroxyglutarate oxidase [Deltaproteobacteria bacterium]